MPSVESTLYYALWCGHCKSIKPNWDQFASQIEKLKGEINGINVIVNKYEESEMRAEKATINGKDIRGYPTIKITVKDDNNKSIEYEYTGKRTADALMSHITNDALSNLKNQELE